MAFILSSGSVISFAEYDDVVARDQRLFEANEGLTDVIVEDALVRATQRILTLIRSSGWWKSYYMTRSPSTLAVDVPEPDANQIIARKPDFTDLAVYYALAEIILPKVADFGNADTAERQKIGFYDEKFRSLFKELIDSGDWYDFNDDNTIETVEKSPTRANLVRIR